MARNQARPNKLVRAEDGTFGTMWGYVMDVQPIEMSLEKEFFYSCRNNLLPGDILRVVELRKKTVTATCTLIVMSKDDHSVTVKFFEGRGIYRYDTPDDLDQPVQSAEKDFHNPELYIEGDGHVEKPLGGDFEIKTSKGTVGYAETLGEAQAKARGDIPLNA